jgi:DNA-binding NtrC family response regulator
VSTEAPVVAEAGWYVELPGPAEWVLGRRYARLSKTDRKAADAQAWLYRLDRGKLRNALASLGEKRGRATLAAALAAEDALRWNELDDALRGFGDLARRTAVAGGAVAAWARLREVEVLERAGRGAEASARLEAARIANADAADPRGELATLRAVVAARLRFRQGDPAGALERLEADPPISDRPSPVRGAWLRGQAIYTSLSGRGDRALGQHWRALDCFKGLGDRYHLVKQYTSLAQTFLEGGELDHADLYGDKAAEALGSLSHPHLQALVKSRRGMIALLRGELDRARTLFAEDLKLSEQAGLRPGRYYARRNLGKVLARLGLRAEGAEHLAASHRGFRHYGDPVNQRLSRTEEIAARLDDGTSPEPPPLAEWHAELESMAAFFAERGREALRSQVDAVRARLLLRRGRLPEARALIEQVAGALRRARRGDRLVEFLCAVAEAYPREGQVEGQEEARVGADADADADADAGAGADAVKDAKPGASSLTAIKAEAEAYLRQAYREAENSGQYWAARRVLKMLDERSELAALDLARAPKIPTGLTVESAGAERQGFYDESRSAPFRRLLQEARNVARSDITVLVLGETGVGKDWLAQHIHRHGPRADQVYRAYNCGAVAESLLEAELFGYEQGAFTGAEQSKVGLFEAADGGTVLLDEVGELSPRAQAALLRVLDQRVVQPVGSTKPREVDVRVLAATNRDLAEDVEAGRFRADLYYRLAVYSLRIPPLRERPEDLPLLVQHFLERMGEALHRQIRGVDDAALDALMRYPWPGNLRELDNVLQAAVLRCQGRGRTIRRKHLPHPIAEPSGLLPLTRFASLADLEKKHIKDALRQVRGNQSEAAKLLGIHRNTLANKLRKYGIEG